MFLGRSDGCTACGAAKLVVVVDIGAVGRHSTFWYPSSCTFGVIEASWIRTFVRLLGITQVLSAPFLSPGTQHTLIDPASYPPLAWPV